MNVWGKLDDGADNDQPERRVENIGQITTREVTYVDNAMECTSGKRLRFG